jgi:hypothetical protein
MGIFDSSAKKQRQQQEIQRRIADRKQDKAFNQRILRDAEREVKRLKRYKSDSTIGRFYESQINEIKYRKNAIKANDREISDLGRKKKWYER